MNIFIVSVWESAAVLLFVAKFQNRQYFFPYWRFSINLRANNPSHFSDTPPGHIENQIRVPNRVIVDQIIQFWPLVHILGNLILDSGAVDRNYSSI